MISSSSCAALESLRNSWRLADINSRASGAVLSMEKSYGLRLGRQRHSRGDMPDGWVECRDIQVTLTPLIRYLSVFLGQPDRVQQVWNEKVTGKMKGRYARWQNPVGRVFAAHPGGFRVVAERQRAHAGRVEIRGLSVAGARVVSQLRSTSHQTLIIHATRHRDLCINILP